MQRPAEAPHGWPTANLPRSARVLERARQTDCVPNRATGDSPLRHAQSAAASPGTVSRRNRRPGPTRIHDFTRNPNDGCTLFLRHFTCRRVHRSAACAVTPHQRRACSPTAQTPRAMHPISDRGQVLDVRRLPTRPQQLRRPDPVEIHVSPNSTGTRAFQFMSTFDPFTTIVPNSPLFGMLARRRRPRRGRTGRVATPVDPQHHGLRDPHEVLLRVNLGKRTDARPISNPVHPVAPLPEQPVTRPDGTPSVWFF